MGTLDWHAERRLQSEHNLWVATVRPDGRPHLTPVWFVWHDSRVYICIDPASIKARNLARNPQIVAALEDGASPIIIEGIERPIDGPDRPPGALDEFERKYGWNIAAESQYSQLIEIVPKKVLNWGSAE